MISPMQVRKQLDRIGVGSLPLCRAELKELPLLLIPGEEIEGLLAGRYVAGYAIMVATNHRLLIVDKKFGGGLIFEDVPYDMIAEVQFVHTPLATQLTVHARSKKIEFRAFSGASVREFAQYLEQRMMESRQQMRTMQTPFVNQNSQENQPYANQQPGLYIP